MKILLATSKAIPAGGGIASYNQELVNLLGKNNEIYLLTDANENNVDGYKETFRTNGHSNADFNYCVKLTNNINNANYDCIINSNSNFIPVISPFLSANVISVSHFVNGRHAINAGFNAHFQTAIIALSNYGKDFLINKFKIPDTSKVRVVYNFVEASIRNSISKKATNYPLRIVYPGGTSIEKSVDVIQNLVYRLLSTNLKFEFIWLGGTTLPIANLSIFGLKKTTNLFQPDSRLIVTDKIPREEALKLIESANIFLLPSRGEGCPMTLLEAMREGCIPIVSDAKHGSREIIENSRAGIIVKQNNVEELFDSVVKIIKEHNKYIHIYESSRKYLNTTLSQNIWNQRMLEILNLTQKKGKIQIEMCSKSFRKSSRLYRFYCRNERLKQILRSVWYRLKIDFNYTKHKITVSNTL